jgi:hypothetical protein
VHALRPDVKKVDCEKSIASKGINLEILSINTEFPIRNKGKYKE